MKRIDVRVLIPILGIALAGCGDKSGPGGSAGSATTPDLTTPDALRAALQAGDAPAVQACMAAGANVSNMIWEGEYPIHLAARSGKKELVEALLAKGADPTIKTQRGYTALHLAATREVAERLLQCGLNVNEPGANRETPLFTAADQGHLDVVEFILSKGADIKARCGDQGIMPLHGAATRAIAERLVAAGSPVWGEPDQWKRNTPPLWIAAGKGRADVVAFLLEKGLPPPPPRGLDEYLSMALFRAVSGRHAAAVEAILDKKESRLSAQLCNENLRRAAGNSDTNTVRAFLAKGLPSPDQYCDALIAAAAKGDAGILKLILDAGGSAAAASSTGYTPLHAAAACKNGTPEEHLACLRLLLAGGADAKRATRTSGQTPLHLAAAADFTAGATLLIERGADVNAPDEVAATPLHWAVINDALKVAELLLSSKANPNLALSSQAAVFTTRPFEVPNPFAGTSVGAQVPLVLAKSDAMKALLKKYGATDTPAPAAVTPAVKPAAPAAKPASPVTPAPAPPPAVTIKKEDTEAAVIAALGQPQARKKAGTETTLIYRGGDVTLVDGKVTEISGQPRRK